MKKLIFFILIFGSISSMAQKITDLPVATGQGIGGIVPIVQGGVTKRISVDSLSATAKRYSDSLKAVLVIASNNNAANIATNSANITTNTTNIATNTTNINTKQNILVQGTGINITGNTISVTGSSNTAADTAFIDFTTGGAIPANTVRFTKKNTANFKDLLINTPAALSAIRRVPGSLQVQGYIGGVWTNQDFTDSIGAGGTGGVAAYYGDTLFFTTTDGNLNIAKTVTIANGELMDIDVNYLGEKDSVAIAVGGVVGRMNASAFKTSGGVLTISSTGYPRTESYYGSAGSSSGNITNNGTGGISINVLGQGGVTYRWKIWATYKRHKI